MCQSMGVCIRAWKFVSERGSLCQSAEVCVRTWKYVSEGGSMCKSVEVLSARGSMHKSAEVRVGIRAWK